MEIIVYYGQLQSWIQYNDFDFFCKRTIAKEQFPEMLSDFDSIDEVQSLELSSFRPEEKIYLFDEKRWITAEEIRILLSRW